METYPFPWNLFVDVASFSIVIDQCEVDYFS